MKTETLAKLYILILVFVWGGCAATSRERCENRGDGLHVRECVAKQNRQK